MGNDDRVHYVVTVHGMGESREFETSRQVANLFGSALCTPGWDAKRPTPPERRISLGTAGGEVHEGTRLWVEFEGVPQPGQAPGAFTGLLATTGQLRFVDLAWNEISRHAFTHHGEAPDRWASSVIARLDAKRPPPPVWVARMLGQVRRAVIVLRRLPAWRLAGVLRVAFDDYLGDVQMYGDYVPARGRAVRRFHDLMARVHAAHVAEFGDAKQPCYTVIAHSLGSVLAFDALMAAHRKGVVDFPGYGADPPPRDWAPHVRSFVTLGSPIDKFLLIWWYRFGHLERAADYERAEPIRHFNYCDEQDPVGHNLDIAASAPGFRAVFDTVEDRVYNRYAVPGQAHLGYFADVDLFRWIHERALKDARPAEGPRWFLLSAYRSLLRFTYFLVPLAVVALNSGFLLWAWKAEGLVQSVVAATLFVGTWWLGRMLIDLSIWWRQIQRAKWRHFDDADRACAGTLREQRAKHAARFRATLGTVVVAAGVGLTAASMWVTLTWQQILPIAGTIAVAWALWRWVLFPGSRDGPDAAVTQRLAWQDGKTVIAAAVAVALGWAAGRVLDPPRRGAPAFLYVAIVLGNAFVVFYYVLLGIHGAKRELEIAGRESDADRMREVTTVAFDDYGR